MTYLAVTKNVSPTTQNQAFNAILFLCKEMMGIDTSEWNIQALRAKRKEHMLVVLIKENELYLDIFSIKSIEVIKLE